MHFKKRDATIYLKLNMKKNHLSIVSVIGMIFAVAFFWVFIFSLWYSNSILDRGNFVNKTTEVLERESVRNAIATEVVDKVRENRPLIGTVTAPILSKIVVGILDTPVFDTIYRRMAQELHLQLTTKNPRPLVIEVRDTAEFIRPLIERQNPDLIDNLPDRIVIIGQNQIPSLYMFGSTLTLGGPLLLVIGIAILGILFKRTHNKRHYFAMLGIVLAASGFLVYFTIPSVGSYLSANATNNNSAVVIDTLYRAFTGELVDLSIGILTAGIIITIASLVLKKQYLKIPARRK